MGAAVVETGETVGTGTGTAVGTGGTAVGTGTGLAVGVAVGAHVQHTVVAESAPPDACMKKCVCLLVVSDEIVRANAISTCKFPSSSSIVHDTSLGKLPADTTNTLQPHRHICAVPEDLVRGRRGTGWCVGVGGNLVVGFWGATRWPESLIKSQRSRLSCPNRLPTSLASSRCNIRRFRIACMRG